MLTPNQVFHHLRTRTLPQGIVPGDQGQSASLVGLAFAQAAFVQLEMRSASARMGDYTITLTDGKYELADVPAWSHIKPMIFMKLAFHLRYIENCPDWLVRLRDREIKMRFPTNEFYVSIHYILASRGLYEMKELTQMCWENKRQYDS